MTTLRTAAQQALEGLEKWQWDKDPGGADDYITALRAALAEPVQEPVAWMYPDDYAGILKHQSRAEVFQKAWCNPAVCVPLFTAPPQRKPLTQEQLYTLYDEHATHQEEGPAMSGWFDFARAIERAHGIGTESPATLSSPRGSLGEEA